MTSKEGEFFNSLRSFSDRGRSLFSDIFDKFDKFVEYEEGRFEALFPTNTAQDEGDTVILRLVDETVGLGVEYNVSADDHQQSMCKSGTATEKEVKKEMPCQFSDGSFRVNNKNTGRLQYRFQYMNEQISVYGASKQECWDKRLAYMQNPPKKKKPKLTFAEWAKKWLENYKKDTVENEYYCSLIGNLKKHINPIIGNKDIKAINSLELQEMLQNIKSDNVRTKCATLIGDCFRTAKVCGLIPTNPYEGVKIKRYQQPELGALTHIQQKQLLGYIDSTMPGTEMNDFIRCLLFTGMRQSELNAIRVENVDFENMQITVDSAWKKKTHELGKTKTKRGKRIIPMVQPLADILRKYCDGRKSECRLFGFDAQEFTYRKIADVFKNLEMPFTAHILRHTFITNAYEFGFPQYLVQRWVGHAGFEEDNTYLALRRASEFCETEVTKYMRLLRKQTVLSLD